MKLGTGILVAATLAAFHTSFGAGLDDLGLAEGKTFGAFVTEATYLDPAGHTSGGRFRHSPSGLVLDLLSIQSVPQAFIWVNSPPPSDQGEPHTCEHLLLGKGTKGRYVASLESMSLGASSAFTSQLQTCYHYNTAAGTDVFFKLLEAKMDALLHPTFSDEEIRREVCHVGYRTDADSSLHLEEKGTVYNEMVSSYERPWYHLSNTMDLLLYGVGHPLSNNAGGLPDSIRNMVPSDMRSFHKAQYRLGNMGIIMSLPTDVAFPDVLKRVSDLLARIQPQNELGSDPTLLESTLPPPHGEKPGTVRVTHFPNANKDEPGLLVYAWPASLDFNNTDLRMLELLLDNVAGGETSDLYAWMIDSQTRRFNLGASDVSSWISEDQGQPIYIAFENVNRQATQAIMIDSVRSLIMGRFAEIAGWADGSPELVEFNRRAENRLLQAERTLSEFLNSPPGFGIRGTGSSWLEHMKHLAREHSFARPLFLDPEFTSAGEQLKSGKNVWKDYIERAQLAKGLPFAVAAQPDPDMLRSMGKARTERIASFVTALEKQYGTNDEKAALQKFKSDYDAKTAKIDSVARTIPMPAFVDAPPLSLDPELAFHTDSLDHRVPCVTSTFENISAGHVGLALGLDVVEKDLQVYIPALPTLLSDVGVVVDGKPIPYDQMKESLQREILYFSTGFSVNHRTRRAELVLRAAGNGPAESELATTWMERALFSADWRPENLPRLRDAVDLAKKNKRQTMQQPEEYWVTDPARAYVSQAHPDLLLADCFLTQIHALHRVGWLLMEPPTGPDLEGWKTWLGSMSHWPEQFDRAGLTALLSPSLGSPRTGPAQAIFKDWDRMPAYAQKLALRAMDDLLQSLSDIPDKSLSSDWSYLCREMDADLMQPTDVVLKNLSLARAELLHSDNARAFATGSTEVLGKIRARLEKVVAALSDEKSVHTKETGVALITERVKERTGQKEDPLFVGLCNENTRSGVFVNTTDCASYADSDPDRLLDFLSAKLYAGGGAHSMFMKTWSAGLAYSNGLRSNESTGRLVYYAERCPDLSQTMQFVVKELEHAPYDTNLAGYAVAQVFSGSRSGRRYEDRSEAMAADLADGVTPDAVKRFRQSILALRDRKDLYRELQDRMMGVYGRVLPGYGPKASDTPQSSYFVIGPEAQLAPYQTYLRSVESPTAEVVRIYPRDYWIPAFAQ